MLLLDAELPSGVTSSVLVWLAGEETEAPAEADPALVSDGEVDLLRVELSLLFMLDPLWREAAAPEAGGIGAGADVMSPVSFREHPANAIRVAAKSANFFIRVPCSISMACGAPRKLPRSGLRLAFT